MYQKNGKSVSLEEVQAAAEALSMSVEDWASEYGWSQGEGEPKKTNDSVVETATVESVPMTSGGESTSGDISLEQSEVSRPVITVKDLNQSEGESAKSLAAKLSPYGITAVEAMGGTNGIKIIRAEDQVSLGERAKNLFTEVFGNPLLNTNAKEGLTVQTGVGLGENLKSKEDLQLIADQMNMYVEEFGNANFVKEESERLPGMYQEYQEAIKPEEYTPEEVSKGITASLGISSDITP